MIITGRFKSRDNRTVESLQPLNEPVVLGALVEHNKTPPSGRPRHLYQNIIALPGNVYRDEHSILCNRMILAMAGLLLFGGGCNNHCKRFCGPVMATCLSAESAAGGHDLPWFRMCHGHEFQARFHWHVEDKGIRHVYIKPSNPQLNGKVERSHRSDQQEFYQRLSYKNDVDLAEKLDEWERCCNFARPHGAFNGNR
jgi:hypothetical protein